MLVPINGPVSAQNVFSLDEWTITTPTDLQANLNRVFWTGQTFIIVGDGGTILASQDGTTWQQRVSNSVENLNSAAWTQGILVVVGDNGTILRSVNGVDWAEVETDFGLLKDVKWQANKFVVVGEGIVAESVDGLTWNTVAAPYGYGWRDISEPIIFDSVAFNEGVSVAVGGLHRTNYVMASPAWEPVNLEVGYDFSSDRFHDVVWTGNQFIAVGGGYDRNLYITSADGINWSDHTFELSGENVHPYENAFSKIKFTGSNFFGIGGPLSWQDGPGNIALMYSQNGLAWSAYYWYNDRFVNETEAKQNVDFSQWGYADNFPRLNDVAWNSSQYIVVGDNGRILTNGTSVIPARTQPVITITGDAEIYLSQGDSFNDPGAVATDSVDGNISNEIVVNGGTINTNIPGTYTITYNVTNSAGIAAAEVTRTVLVYQKEDFNQDGSVGFNDLATLASNYNSTNSAFDLNNDGIVNLFDLVILARKM